MTKGIASIFITSKLEQNQTHRRSSDLSYTERKCIDAHHIQTKINDSEPALGVNIQNLGEKLKKDTKTKLDALKNSLKSHVQTKIDAFDTSVRGTITNHDERIDT